MCASDAHTLTHCEVVFNKSLLSSREEEPKDQLASLTYSVRPKAHIGVTLSPMIRSKPKRSSTPTTEYSWMKSINLPLRIPPAAAEDFAGGELGEMTITISADFTISNLRSRWEKAAMEVIKAVQEAEEIMGECYLQPVLVADDVGFAVLKRIPSHVGEYCIKTIVRNRQLFITDIVARRPRGAAISIAIAQLSSWNDANDFPFAALMFVNTAFGENGGGAPDAVLSSRTRYSLPGMDCRCLVIIEVEVSNRPVPRIRDHCAVYFEDDAVVAVIGLKFFGPRIFPVRQAVAVLWSRAPGGGQAVTAIRDFGFEPISTRTMDSFAAARAGALPPIPPAAWATNRHVPLSLAQLDPPPENGMLTPEQMRMWVLKRDNPTSLYAMSTVPTLAVPGGVLAGALRDFPAHRQPLQDLELNLAKVLFNVSQF